MRRAAPAFGATTLLLLVAMPALAQAGSTLRPEVSRIDTPDEFGSPRSIHVGPGGDVHVVFDERPFVRSRVAASEEWRVVPLPGAPESFVPARLGWSGDRMWAVDRSQTAVWLEGEGRAGPSFQELYLPRPSMGPRAERLLAVDGSGRRILSTSGAWDSMAAADPRSAAVFADLPPGVTLPRPVDSLPVWDVRTDGTIADTFAMVSTANRVLVLPVSRGAGVSGMGTFERLIRLQPLSDHPLIAASPTGSLVVVERWAERGGAPPAYLLRVFEPDGRGVGVHSLPYAPVPVRTGWADSTIVELARDLAARGEDLAAATETASRMLYQPDHVPAVSATHMGPDGWIWVRRYGLSQAGEQEWEIVDPAGTRVGVASLDAGFEVTAVHGRTAWATASEGTERRSMWLVEVR